jgi:hypothetical protein
MLGLSESFANHQGSWFNGAGNRSGSAARGARAARWSSLQAMV